MAVNIRQYIAAGFDRAHYWMNDSAGVAAGATGTVPAGTVGSPSGRLQGVRTSDISIPDPVEFTRAGDDQPLGKFIFGSTETPGFTIEADAEDLTFRSRIAGLTVQDIGDLSLLAGAAKDITFADMGFIFLRRAKSKQAGSDGTSMYESLIIPQANVYALGSPYEFQGGGPTRYRVALSMTNILPTGITLTNAANGTDAAAFMVGTHENRIDVHAFVGDAAQTVFTVQYTPAGTTVAKTHVYVAGLRLAAGVTVSQANKTITIAAPGAAGKTIVMYEYTE